MKMPFLNTASMNTGFMNTGVKISGAAHAGLILWAVLGGFLNFDSRDEMEFSEVTLISGEQFEAMLAAGGGAVPETPDAPVAPTPPTDPELAPDTPAEDVPPEVVAPPEPTTADAPDAEPEFDPTFETSQAEVSATAPEAPTAPPQPEGAAVALAPDRAPAPRAAPRIAPQAAAAPEPDTTVAEEVQQAVRPDATAVAETPTEAQEATAPEEAATRTEPDATPDGGGTQVALAPSDTPRPRTRPSRPTPTPAAQPAEAAPSQPAAEASEDDAAEDAIAAAVAAAVADSTAPASASEGTGGVGTARTGPPLTSGEKDALRIGVQKCWNIGSLSSEAQRVTVTVFVAMNEDSTPDSGSIRMVDFEGGSQAAANKAYETARRAILRCGSKGFDLPPEKYGQWQEIEMTFNPDQMRIR